MNHRNILDKTIYSTLIASFIFWVCLLSFKFYSFGYNDWDLAIFTQTARNLGLGSQYCSIGDYNFFGDHATFIILLVVPIFKVIAHPLVLVFIKIIAFHAAAFSLYVISKKYIHSLAALFLMLTFLIFPPNIFAMLYEFNFDCIGMVLFFWIIYFYWEEKYKLFIITFIFALLIKENVYLLFMTFGIFAFFKNRNKITWGVIPLISGALLFYTVIFHVVPHFRGMEISAFVTRYNHLGGSVGEIFKRIVIDPMHIISLLFMPANIRFLMKMFGALLPFSLLSPHVLLLSGPLFLQHLLSENMAEHTIKGHYSHFLVPFIFLSAVHTLRYFISLFKIPRVKIVIGLSVFILSATVYLSPRYIDGYLQQFNMADRETTKNSWRILRSIPSDASVIATFEFLAPMSVRDHLYSFHRVYDERFQTTDVEKMDPFMKEQVFKLPDHVQYAVIDFNDVHVKNALREREEVTKERIELFFNDNNWQLKNVYKSIMSFERLTHQQAVLLEQEKAFRNLKINLQVEGKKKSSLNLRFAQ